MIGGMRHRITLENPRRIDNGRGGYKVDYENGLKMEVWADASILNIRQQLAYQQWDRAAEIRFIIRENPFLKADTRIIFEGRLYEIVQFAPTATRFLEVRAREV